MGVCDRKLRVPLPDSETSLRVPGSNRHDTETDCPSFLDSDRDSNSEKGRNVPPSRVLTRKSLPDTEQVKAVWFRGQTDRTTDPTPVNSSGPTFLRP